MNVAVEQRPLDSSSPDPAAPAEFGEFERLLTAMRAGSQHAAQEIVDTYGPHIRAVVKRRLASVLRPTFDSEDFVQSAWKSLLRMPAEKIDEVHQPRQLVNLMAQIAARKIIDQYRHRTQPACDEGRRRTFDDPEVISALAKIAGIETPSQLCIAREKQDLYRERWETLVSREAPHYQRIVYLRLEGQPFSAIAESEQVSESTARRIFKKLFDRLSAERAA